ncbi:MAG: EAL domain-containing protein [Actinomycetota bacterium]
MSRSDRSGLLVLAAVGFPLLGLLFVTARGWDDLATAVATAGLAGGLVAGLRVRNALAAAAAAAVPTRIAFVDPEPSPTGERAAAPTTDPTAADDERRDAPAGADEADATVAGDTDRPDDGAVRSSADERALVADREPAEIGDGINRGELVDLVDGGPSSSGPLPFDVMIERCSDVFVVVDRELTIVAISPSVERVMGYRPEQLVGTSMRDLLDTASAQMVRQLVRRPATELDGTVLDVDVDTMPGRPLLAELTMAHVDGGSMLLVLRDVTVLRRLEESLRSRAVLDQPTGLLNRSSFEYELQATLRRLPPDHLAAVVTLVLADFGEFHDAVGTVGGNHLLKEVADRLREALRGVDVLARTSEVEFAVVAIGPSERSLRRFADRLAWVFEEPFEIDGRAHHLRVAVGMATTRDRWAEVDRLMQAASVALHQAEQRGGDEVVVYDQTLQDQIDQRFELSSALRPALDRGEFRLVYQPLLSLETGDIVSFEALLRWNHPTLGPISPATFIPLAERSGLIVELGRWVVEEACRQLVDWRVRLDGFDRLTMGVNLSARQLERHGELDALIYLVEGAGLDPQSLVVELTESAMIDDAGWIRSQLQHLRELGSHIAIDDFGTGVAGLSHLRELPYDVVKIDKSYVDRVGVDATGENLVAQIIDLARGLGASSVAEGIETEEQARRLTEMGCDIGQGFHLARPMEVTAVEQWMVEHGVGSTGGR